MRRDAQKVKEDFLLTSVSLSPTILLHMAGYTKTSRRLRRLLRESPLTLKEIALRAKVNPDTVQKWVRGSQQSVTLEVGERLWRVLTGKGFMD